MARSDFLAPQSEASTDGEDTEPISAGEALNILEDTLTKWLAPLSTLLPPIPAVNAEAATSAIAHPLIAKWLDPPPHAISKISENSALAPTAVARDSFLLRIVLPSPTVRRQAFKAPISAIIARHLSHRLETAQGPEEWGQEDFKVLNLHHLCAHRYSAENKVSSFAVGRTLAAKILQGSWLESDVFLEKERKRTEGLKMEYDERAEGEEVIRDEVVEIVLERLLDQLAEQGWRVNIIIDGLEACENYVWVVRVLTRMVDRDLLGCGVRGTFRVIFTGGPREMMCGILRKWAVARIVDDGTVKETDNGSLVAMVKTFEGVAQE